MASRRNYTKGTLEHIRRRKESGASISQNEARALWEADVMGASGRSTGGVASVRRGGRIETPGAEASRVINGPRRNDPRRSGSVSPFRVHGTLRDALNEQEAVRGSEDPGGSSRPDELRHRGEMTGMSTPESRRAFFQQNLGYHTDSRPGMNAEKVATEMFERVKNPNTDAVMQDMRDKGIVTGDRNVRVGGRDVHVSGGSFGFSVGSGGATTPGISRSGNLDVNGKPLYSDQRAVERANVRQTAAESARAMKEASGDTGMRTISDAGSRLAVSNMRDEVAGGADAGDVVDRMISRMQDSINKDFAKRQVHAEAEARRNATPEQRLAGMRGETSSEPGANQGGSPAPLSGQIASATGNQQFKGQTTSETTRAVETGVQNQLDQMLNNGVANTLNQMDEDRKRQGAMTDWGGGISARARRFLDRRRSEASMLLDGHLARARQVYADLGGGQTANKWAELNAKMTGKPVSGPAAAEPSRQVGPNVITGNAGSWAEALSPVKNAEDFKATAAPKGGDIRYVEKNGNYYKQTYRQGSSEATSGWSGQLVQKSEYDKFHAQLDKGASAQDADKAATADIDRKIQEGSSTKFGSEDRRRQLEEMNAANRAKADAPVGIYHEETAGERAMRTLNRAGYNLAGRLGLIETHDSAGNRLQNPYSQAPMRLVGHTYTLNSGKRFEYIHPKSDAARGTGARVFDAVGRGMERVGDAVRRGSAWARNLERMTSWGRDILRTARRDDKGGHARKTSNRSKR